MIKLEGKTKIVNGVSEIVYPPRVIRETQAVHQKRPIVVELCVSGVQVGLKGTQQYYVVPYDTLFIDAQRSSVSLSARGGAVTQKTAAALINRDMEIMLRSISKRIGAGSGTASWTSDEHDKIVSLLDQVPA